MKIEASVIVDRPREQIWTFMTDLSNTPKWDPGVPQVRQTSAGPVGIVELSNQFTQNRE